MPLLPVARAKKVTFYKVRLLPWAEEAALLGLDPATVALLGERVEAARAALDAQQRARSQYRTATQAARDLVAEMCELGAGMIQTIRATAATEGERTWTRAMLPPPAGRSKTPPPGQPSNLRVTLRAGDGSLELRWSCRNPRGSKGTIYEVRRQDGPDRPMVFLATVGKKKFVDATVPRGGAAEIVYEITAVRSPRRGVANRFLVNFGVDAQLAQQASAAVRQAA
jgi:hypothetical protein